MKQKYLAVILVESILCPMCLKYRVLTVFIEIRIELSELHETMLHCCGATEMRAVRTRKAAKLYGHVLYTYHAIWRPRKVHVYEQHELAVLHHFKMSFKRFLGSIIVMCANSILLS